MPVPLHGDLWPGNLASDSHGPVIFDPAGYYGHGEADLGMTRMFGGESKSPRLYGPECAGRVMRLAPSHSPLTRLGFTKEFYDAYHAIHPRSEPYHEQRIRLYELYHHLNVSPIHEREWLCLAWVGVGYVRPRCPFSQSPHGQLSCIVSDSSTHSSLVDRIPPPRLGSCANWWSGPTVWTPR